MPTFIETGGWRKLVAVTAQAEWARRPKLESAGL